MPPPASCHADPFSMVGKPLPTGFATGADLLMVRDLLGHADVATTERYLRQPSGIASDGRVCAGRLVTGVPQ